MAGLESWFVWILSFFFFGCTIAFPIFFRRFPRKTPCTFAPSHCRPLYHPSDRSSPALTGCELSVFFRLILHAQFSLSPFPLRGHHVPRTEKNGKTVSCHTCYFIRLRKNTHTNTRRYKSTCHFSHIEFCPRLPTCRLLRKFWPAEGGGEGGGGGEGLFELTFPRSRTDVKTKNKRTRTVTDSIITYRPLRTPTNL